MEKIIFSTKAAKDFFFEVMEGREKTEADRRRQRQLRKEAVEYCRGEYREDEAVKRLGAMTELFFASRGLNQEHLAQAYSQRRGPEPPLTGSEFMKLFIEKNQYFYYSDRNFRRYGLKMSLDGRLMLHKLNQELAKPDSAYQSFQSLQSFTPEARPVLIRHFASDNNLEQVAGKGLSEEELSVMSTHIWRHLTFYTLFLIWSNYAIYLQFWQDLSIKPFSCYNIK